MPSTSKIMDIHSVKGFPINNPKVKIVSDRGRLRAVERKYFWDRQKHRGLEKRKYIGYIIDNTFYDNETYNRIFKRNGVRRLIPSAQQEDACRAESPSALQTLRASELPLYYAVAKETGLIEDLISVWGDIRARAVLSLAFHWLNTSFNAVYLFDSWSEDKVLPYKERLTAKEITQLFRSLVAEPAWRKSFFAARVSRLPETEVLSFDATQIASEAEEVTYAQYGKGKEGGYQYQVGLIVLLGHKSRMPVLFRILPGNITDMTTVPDMIFRFEEITDKKRVFAAVLDRGYCSLDNIARFIDNNSRVIMAAKIDFTWVQDAIETVMERLWMNSNRIAGQSCWGATVPVERKFPDGRKRTMWVHVYRSDIISHTQNEAFYAKLDRFESDWKEAAPGAKALQKSSLLKYYQRESGKPPKIGVGTLLRNDDAIDAAIRYNGCFCNVTTFQCTAADALLDYQMRDSIEKSFKAGKTYVEMDTVRAHSDAVTEGRFIVSFCCMTILNEIYRRMKLHGHIIAKNGKPKAMPPLENEVTFNQIRNYLSPIRLVYDGKGGCRWQETTLRQRQIAERLGFIGLYETVPDWA